MKKILIALFLALSAVPAVSFTVSAALEGKKAQAIIEGDVTKKIRVYEFSGDTYFSVRQMADVYGGDLIWHPVTGKVALTMHNRRLDIFIKSTRILLSGKRKRLTVPTRSVSGDVFIPANFILSRDFADFSETTSSWNSDTGVLTVDKKINIMTPRFYTRPGSTEIVLELLDDLPYQLARNKKNQLTVSFPRGQAVKETVDVDDGVVRSVSLSNQKRDALVTIALDSEAGAIEKKFLRKPPRLVIDISRLPAPAAGTEAVIVSSISPSAALTAPQAAPGVAILTSSAAVSAVKHVPQKKKLVVLDAGHGGEDPGAVGRGGTKEKDINLAIVKELKRLFEEDAEYDVLLTRSDDTFIPLVDRTNLANEKKADLFVSVHSNASLNKKTGGFEIYFLSETASDSDAAATAVLENSVVNLEKKPSRKQTQLQQLLWSMVVNEFINEASELCSLIGSEVARRIKIENRGVKQAGFYVLRGAQMPAVLVECAFLSNTKEESRLNGKKFQRQMADAVYQGVRNYEMRKNGKRTMNVKQYRMNAGTYE